MLTIALPRSVQRTEHVQRMADLLIALRPAFPTVEAPRRYHHMCALLADAALQAGVRYTTVVRPRVQKLLELYPNSSTVSATLHLLQRITAHELLGWSHRAKPQRFVDLVNTCAKHGVDSVADLGNWIETTTGTTRLLAIPGIGPKTVDYLGLLAGQARIPMDRHLLLLASLAGVPPTNYHYAQSVVVAACEDLGLDIRRTEHALWGLLHQCV